MTISINDVRNGVISKLTQNYPSIDIYGEVPELGFQAPCFYVNMLPVEHKRELNRRYYRNHSFDIQYFGTSNDDMHTVAESLYDILEYNTMTDSSCRGTKMKDEIIDNVLHFYVNYGFHVMSEKPIETKLNSLEVNEYAK